MKKLNLVSNASFTSVYVACRLCDICLLLLFVRKKVPKWFDVGTRKNKNMLGDGYFIIFRVVRFLPNQAKYTSSVYYVRKLIMYL